MLAASFDFCFRRHKNSGPCIGLPPRSLAVVVIAAAAVHDVPQRDVHPHRRWLERFPRLCTGAPPRVKQPAHPPHSLEHPGHCCRAQRSLATGMPCLTWWCVRVLIVLRRLVPRTRMSPQRYSTGSHGLGQQHSTAMIPSSSSSSARKR